MTNMNAKEFEAVWETDQFVKEMNEIERKVRKWAKPLVFTGTADEALDYYYDALINYVKQFGIDLSTLINFDRTDGWSIGGQAHHKGHIIGFTIMAKAMRKHNEWHCNPYISATFNIESPVKPSKEYGWFLL